MKKCLLLLVSAVVIGIVAGCKSSNKIDRMSPYWYDAKQKEVTFSDDGRMLCRFPHNSPVESYVIPSTVSSIQERAFQQVVNLKSVTIPYSVKDIEMATFYCCTDLERLYIQTPLEDIPFRFLQGCNNLKELHLVSTIPPAIEVFDPENDEDWNIKLSFGDSYKESLILYVPKGSMAEYKNAYGWKQFKNIKEE